jgi:hypothetical protein
MIIWGYFHDVLLYALKYATYVLRWLKRPFAILILGTVVYQLIRIGGHRLWYLSPRVPSISLHHPCRLPLLSRIIDCPRSFAFPTNYTQLLDLQADKFGELREKGLISRDMAKDMHYAAARDVPSLQFSLEKSSLKNKQVLVDFLGQLKEKMDVSGSHLQSFHALVSQEILT